MIIEKLNIKGFRNLEHYDILFSAGANLIHGSNGAGKTSILESIFLLAFGKSFLNRKKIDMLNYNCDEFLVRADTQNLLGHHQVSGYFKYRYSALIDEKKSNIFEINRYLYPVFFSSSDYNLYIENTPYTRKMMDRFIFGVDTLYIRYLLSYNKTLKQKNNLLKTTRNLSELRSWNKMLAELAEKLVGIKMKFIEQLNCEIKRKFDNSLKITYQPSLNLDQGVLGDVFFKQLESMTERELHSGRSLAGPHRDGYAMDLNSKALSAHSSGEKKIHLLMIYISFIEYFKRVKSEYPIFMVDDFDTAMDSKNIAFLIENYPQMQVIATSVNQHHKFDRLIELEKEN